MTAATFLAALEATAPGTKIAYHIGSLMFDRLPHGNSVGEHERAFQVDELAKTVWSSAGMGKDDDGYWHRNKKLARCNLVQRRMSDPFGCEYIAVKI